MKRKVYIVSGFDCAVCAGKAEAHIAKQKDVDSARMDFTNNKLYIVFKNEPWDCEKLGKVIAEVESDPLNISEDNKRTITCKVIVLDYINDKLNFYFFDNFLNGNTIKYFCFANSSSFVL